MACSLLNKATAVICLTYLLALTSLAAPAAITPIALS